MFARVDPVAEDAHRGIEPLRHARDFGDRRIFLHLAVLPDEDLLVVPAEANSEVLERREAVGSSASRFWLTGCVAVHDLGEAVVVVRGLDEHRVEIAGSRGRAGNGRIVEQDRKLHGGEELAFGAVFQ